MGASARHGGFLSVLMGVATGFVLKWLLGSDDLVWLAPFMVRGSLRHKVRIGIKYVLSVTVLTVVACVLAVAINSSSGSKVADEVIGTAAGVLLLAFALHMAHEEGYLERCEGSPEAAGAAEEGYGAVAPVHDGANDEDDEEEMGPLKTALSAQLEGASGCLDAVLCCGDESDDEGGDDEKKQARSTRDVLVVAFLGSMDDFMVYFSIALADRIPTSELVVGIALGAVSIAVVVGALLEASEAVASCVEAIPVPLVLGLLGVWVVASSWEPGLEPY